ncbi:N-acetyl-1-D-myo-inositol-2-amino-2-deoxy-alpha-D-glucopyranoside deacetylase [Dictyobacter aurantiacus]|uniref:Mycothiol S-conjugate amidase n=1 Tax=Dictyobacter aurantiacus TaxID=1936993 RepID=A0A401ZMA8_9CHLR|nr:N-acetyl-1-D-myo-inositol-2-amino-2-deoxy-alpha-D-glucopyranoside deacetylase [Dictyobacter aurantiacus]GCE07993.1 mycothiol S-conjugate amidase [Dictyobacter aurantiacus]
MSQTEKEPLTFMAVHAHPDDEVFGTGGTFARYAAQGIRTVLVTATLGEEGEIVDPALDEQAKEAMFPRLAEVRRQELKAAVEALNIQESRLLGFRDSGMAGTPSNNHPESFYRAVFDEAVRRLVALIRELKPQVLVTYDAFGGYGHPDHIQANRVTNAAFDAAGDARCFPDLSLPAWQPSRLYYTAMPRSAMIEAMKEMQRSGAPGPWNNPAMNTAIMGTPDELITARIDVCEYIDHKMKAFAAHKTQIAPDSFMFTIPEAQREQALGYEYFVLVRSALQPVAGELQQDLMADLK